jgi:hypothetical protein
VRRPMDQGVQAGDSRHAQRLALAHEALAGGRDERHGLREEHAHRVT